MGNAHYFRTGGLKRTMNRLFLRCIVNLQRQRQARPVDWVSRYHSHWKRRRRLRTVDTLVRLLRVLTLVSSKLGSQSRIHNPRPCLAGRCQRKLVKKSTARRVYQQQCPKSRYGNSRRESSSRADRQRLRGPLHAASRPEDQY
jgi:hypothetical protein